jgi:hypothetical protein
MNVYVFDFGDRIKIGRAGDVKTRLRNIEFQSGQKAVNQFSIEADGRYEILLHKLLSEYRNIGEYFTFPFVYAVSLLKSLIRFEFAKEVKQESQLFLPLAVEKKVVIEKPTIVEKEVVIEKEVIVEKHIISEGKGLTIDEMCEALKLPFKTVEARIQRAGIKPLSRQAVYPSGTLDIIKDVKMGRPKKQPESKTRKAKK